MAFSTILRVVPIGVLAVACSATPALDTDDSRGAETINTTIAETLHIERLEGTTSNLGSAWTAEAQAAAGIQLDQGFLQARQDLPEVVEVPVHDAGEILVPEGAPERAPDVVEHYAEDQPEENLEFANLSIPSLDLEAVVFEGVTSETLRKGPGHMPWTPLPGQPGNAVISGHRTTYGRPFFNLDQLKPGDRIEIETTIGIHVYLVRDSFVVKPTDVWVTEDRVGGWLTMTTCNPKFSARERLIITAELVEGPNAAYIGFLLEGRVRGLS